MVVVPSPKFVEKRYKILAYVVLATLFGGIGAKCLFDIYNILTGPQPTTTYRTSDWGPLPPFHITAQNHKPSSCSILARGMRWKVNGQILSSEQVNEQSARLGCMTCNVVADTDGWWTAYFDPTCITPYFNESEGAGVGHAVSLSLFGGGVRDSGPLLYADHGTVDKAKANGKKLGETRDFGDQLFQPGWPFFQSNSNTLALKLSKSIVPTEGRVWLKSETYSSYAAAFHGNYQSIANAEVVFEVKILSKLIAVTEKVPLVTLLFKVGGQVGGFVTIIAAFFHFVFVRKYPMTVDEVESQLVTLRGQRKTERADAKTARAEAEPLLGN